LIPNTAVAREINDVQDDVETLLERDPADEIAPENEATELDEKLTYS
jgi:hypothetical protein